MACGLVEQAKTATRPDVTEQIERILFKCAILTMVCYNVVHIVFLDVLVGRVTVHRSVRTIVQVR